ncbi:gliding motility lipoprotein GldB [Wenyingzhuangia sp. IMCC45533]
MKKWIALYSVVSLLMYCTPVDKKEEQIAQVNVDTQFSLFHKAFFNAKAQDIPVLKKEYPYMFPERMTDSVVLKRMNDTIQRDLFAEVNQVYGDFEAQEQALLDLFKHIKYYFEEFNLPIVVTDISGISYQNRILYGNDMLLVSLDMYLGKNHEFYASFPAYLKETFTPNHLPVDVAKKIIEAKYRIERDRTFLGQMIFEGKKLYLLDLFLPKVSDEIKLGYASEKMDWSRKNEAAIWAYFIKNEMLYSNNPKLKQRFINLAPFSKFYKSIDKESPGGIAKYIGLQIVRSYAKSHPEITPAALMRTDAQTLMDTSGFKPQKK